jgi:hypothetical protein
MALSAKGAERCQGGSRLRDSTEEKEPVEAAVLNVDVAVVSQSQPSAWMAVVVPREYAPQMCCRSSWSSSMSTAAATWPITFLRHGFGALNLLVDLEFCIEPVFPVVPQGTPSFDPQLVRPLLDDVLGWSFIRSNRNRTHFDLLIESVNGVKSRHSSSHDRQ